MTEAPLLLTPGPLTVSNRVRAAMNRDWGSRDEAFTALTTGIRRRLVEIAGADPARVTAVPLQGAGTFAVEAMLAAFAPPDAPTLVLVNGAYGRRIVTILKRLGRPYRTVEGSETEPTDLAAVAAALDGVAALVVVHCETTTGILNPVSAIAALARQRGIAILVDAMSSFGALPVAMEDDALTAVAASSNKGLQGAPGLGFVLCDRVALAATQGRAPTLSLDLCDQDRGFEATGEWRFTPPTHVVAALAEALDELEDEGGPTARRARYEANLAALTGGMDALGFRAILRPRDQAPVIVTFAMPDWPWFTFDAFYAALKAKGFVIYPGKLTQAPSFRVGCIGDVTPPQMEAFVTAARDVLRTMAT